MSNEKFAKIETKIEDMEEKQLIRIDNEAEQISDIKSTVESISVKLDERTAALKESLDERTKGSDEKFSSQEKN